MTNRKTDMTMYLTGKKIQRAKKIWKDAQKEKCRLK